MDNYGYIVGMVMILILIGMFSIPLYFIRKEREED